MKKIFVLLLTVCLLFGSVLSFSSCASRAPRVEDTEAIRRWARMLRDVGYTGNISLECIYDGDPMPHIRATRPVIELFRSV